MNRLASLFSRKRSGILSVFFTAGAPRLDSTSAIALSLDSAGVDLIEIGIPFSDPVADGPVIQESNKMALQNGMSVKRLIDQVREIRASTSIPIVLMGYCNPVLHYGFERFCADCARSGVDGMILPDLPLDQYLSTYRDIADHHGLAMTLLVSPTTPEERIRQIDEVSSPFIYAVSASSTTGARDSFTDSQLRYFGRLKSLKLRNPFLIGFGISNGATFSKACEFGAGAVVGSAFISMLKASENIRQDIPAFVQQLKGQSPDDQQQPLPPGDYKSPGKVD